MDSMGPFPEQNQISLRIFMREFPFIFGKFHQIIMQLTL